MRRIVQITPNYPPLLGGLERVVQILATTLADRHEVSVVTTTHGAPGVPRRVREGDVGVRRHRSVTVAHTALAPGMLGSLLRIPRGSVVHLHCSQAVVPELVWLAARLRGTRYLVHFHMDVGTSGPLGRLLPAYKKHFFGRVLRGAAAVIVLIDSQVQFMSEFYGVDPQRIHVVPNGVAPEYYLPPRTPEAGTLRLLYVGRLGAQKNVARLLDAMSLVTEPVRLRIVGDGELRAGLEAQAARLELGDRVEFCGRLHGADLVDAYADAQAFVLPSDREGMPLVVMEAMAAGLPVIATAVQGTIELVDGVGLLAEPDPEALAAAIDQVARDPEARAKMAAEGSARARAYTWDAVVAAVERVYDEAGL
jgi:glycosyltransferase involved in cell wall biosynthesis